jgi:hypothetical protein
MTFIFTAGDDLHHTAASAVARTSFGISLQYAVLALNYGFLIYLGKMNFLLKTF